MAIPGPRLTSPYRRPIRRGIEFDTRHQMPCRGGGMDFLGMPDVSPHVFFGLTAASLVTSFLGISTGAAGGLLLLALMASVLPPAVLLPIHTVVQLGSGITRTLMMWRHVMPGTLPPFIIGAIIGAAAGAKIFVALPINILEGILGLF